MVGSISRIRQQHIFPPSQPRAIAGCLALALLLCACQERQQPSRTAPVTSRTADVAATQKTNPASLVTRASDASEGDIEQPGSAPRTVADTTPVDTRILGVQLSDNGDGKRLTGITTDRFKSSDGVFLSIRTTGTANKYTLSSRWLDPTGKRLTEYSQTIAAAGQTDTVFSLSKPDGWPKGRYQVELSINGKLLRIVPFTVQ